MFAIAKKFVHSVLPGIVKPLHSLWNEVLGFLFLAIALLLVRSIWRSYLEAGQGVPQMLKFLLGLFFFLVMLGFGIQAFVKARRISRS